ncbi:hypothetical protein [Nonomuraea turcica]|nr:hypothetical protein [Nonomuraea sp. G32]MDP4504034.1 hypothetical protein [Nonomuraea sp. G32]
MSSGRLQTLQVGPSSLGLAVWSRGLADVVACDMLSMLLVE